ncbi:GntR family transcriptional regulator [Streptomyces sp. NPDC047002]|uniref:GntR family transcriptional regulator n=1 Tax=Streptomyces sp. NPDC047002 TaxID=3155475 RepID=UPI003454355C
MADRPATIVTDSLSEQAYRLLRDKIVRGDLRQGQRLDLTALSQEAGVSRTPIRGALARLEADQLVLTRPRSGTFVAVITERDIDEVCGMRQAIEWFATYEATSRMPDEVKEDLRREIEEADRAMERGDFEPFFHSDMNLHRTIIRYSGNTRMMAVRDSLEAYLEWLRIAGASGTHRTGAAAARHHEIVDAMLAGDAERAQNLASLHVSEVRAWTLADFRELGLGAPDGAGPTALPQPAGAG